MSFSFGSDTSSSFSFGQSTPSFNFGGGSTDSGTSFNFGWGGAASSSSSSTASSGFSFGSDSGFGGGGGGGGGFSFGPNTQQATPSFSFTAPSTGNSVFPSSSVLDEDKPERRIQTIEDAYNPQASNCRFRFMLYNKTDPSKVALYRPPSNVNMRLWQQAVQNNPDPKTLVPTQVQGLEDLKKRIEQQNIAQAAYQQWVDKLRDRIKELQQQHDVTQKQQIETMRKTMIDQGHRLVKVMTKLESNRARGLPLLNTELDFRRKLESLKKRMSKLTDRVSELSSLVKSRDDRPSENQQQSLPTLDADNLTKIHQILEQQRRSLAHVTATVKADINTVKNITPTS
eukprot:TRINITY_DN1924_c0_g1_i1.p1 TRINITY_DN1924_c0_g1~~TRINITY_DN1924_c0_g1_i1.p1  ORF type:complete len:342 (-),score=93.92 TRINITY_DN1924_c0_g1_i1:513-1538(-)